MSTMLYMTEDRADVIDTPPAIGDHGGGEGPEPIHIVAGRWELFVSGIARRFPRLLPIAPRAACGLILWADPDRPGPMPYPLSPFCPECLAVVGGDPDDIAAGGSWTPGYSF